MYQKHSGFEPAQIVGQRFELICVAQYQLTLHITGGFKITIEGEYVLENGLRSVNASAEKPAVDFIIPFTEATIIGAYFDKNFNFCILFECGTLLKLINSPHFESFIVTVAGKSYVY